MKIIKASITDITHLKEVCRDIYTINFRNHWNDGGLAWYLDKEFSINRLTSDVKSTHTNYYFIKDRKKTIGFFKITTNSMVHPPLANNIELEKI